MQRNTWKGHYILPLLPLFVCISVFSWFFLSCNRTKPKENPGLYINEIMASNNRSLIDDNGEFSDWVELYNSSDAAVPLKDYCLSDEPDNPLKWRFPDVIIPAGQYLVVFASGSAMEEEDIYLHAPFRLNARDDALVFSDPDGFTLDRVAISGHQPDISFGRTWDHNQPEWTFFTGATPGFKNNREEYLMQDSPEGLAPLFVSGSPAGKSDPSGNREKTGKIRFSLMGGYFAEPQVVEMKGDADKILYTLDGSEPDENSFMYESPLCIDRTTVVRARGMSQGVLQVQVTTCSFFFNSAHDLPVISLVTDPENLWNTETGMIAPGNIEKELERPIHVEFFESNGHNGFRLDAGIKLFGHSSRLLAQRPFYILTRKRYGRKTIKYRLFPEKDIRIFKSFLLRNGGEDGRYARIRDTVTSTLIRELGVDAQASRPVVVYLNGEYWGQYFLRDKIDEYFLAYHHNVANPADIDLIEGNGNVMAGEYAGYHSLMQYLSSHDARKPEVYEYLKTQIDIENLINYELAQIYFANTDMGNIRFWRERSPGGKWRWILFDTDWSLYVIERDAFKWNLDPGGRGYLKYFSTLVISSLLKNNEFKAKFITQCIHLLNTTFSPGHVCALIEKIVDSIKNEMPAHCARWQVSMEEWERQVEMIREFARKRPAYLSGQLMSFFGLSKAEYEQQLFP